MAHVLLVDDNEPVRAALTAYLRLFGYVVTEAPNARAALTRYGPHIDIVVAQLGMRGRSGAEIMRKLRDRGETIPTILMSGRFPHPGEVADAEFVIHKPFEPKALLRAIDRILACGSMGAFAAGA